MWTVSKNGGDEMTLDQWGMKNVQCVLNSQAASTISFTIKVDRFETAPVFAPDDRLDFYYQEDGQPETKRRFFVGWIATNPRGHSAQAEAHSYTVKDSWWWLERLIFQKLWFRAVDPANTESSLVGGYTPWIILNQGVNGVKLTTRAQWEEIIDFCNESAVAQEIGEVMQAGEGYPEIQIPIDEKKNILCSEAMRLQFRWLGDAVSYFDYTQEPPMLHIKRRAQMAAVPLTIGVDIHNCELTAREDLRVPCVILKYEQTNTTDGQGRLQEIQDVFPPGSSDRQFDAFVETINLAGYNLSYARAEIEAVQWGTQDWFFEKVPWLKSAMIPNPETDDTTPPLFTIETATYPDGSVFYYNRQLTAETIPLIPDIFELRRGTITPGKWMLQAAGEPVWNPTANKNYDVVVSNVILKGKVQYSKKTKTNQLGKWTNREWSVNVNLLNVGSGTFRRMTSFQEGDPIPQGLAQALYEAYGFLHHEGTINFKDAEVRALPSIGNVVNITNGDAAWQNMNAIVQGVSMNIDTGEKSIRIGPPTFLSGADLKALLFITRTRASYTAPQTMDSGEAPAQQIDNPEYAPERSVTLDDDPGRRMVLTQAAIIGNDPSLPNSEGYIDSGFRFIEIDVDEARLRMYQQQPTLPPDIVGDPRDPQNTQGIAPGTEIDISMQDANSKVVKLRLLRIPLVVEKTGANQLRVRYKQLMVLSEDPALVGYEDVTINLP